MTTTVMVFKKTATGLEPVKKITNPAKVNRIVKKLNSNAKSIQIVDKPIQMKKGYYYCNENIKIIRFTAPQFIFSYLTDGNLIDFLLDINIDFTIYFNKKKIKIETVDIYHRLECSCLKCRKVVINDDLDNTLDKMDSNCFIEVQLDDDILQIIAEKQFNVIEEMVNKLTQLPSSIPSYPTHFLPPRLDLIKYIDLT